MSFAVTSAQAFEQRYRDKPDPWNFARSAYEQNRYDCILKACRRTHYQSAFEPGCSIGELTVKLAPLCEKLTASDFAASAVARATIRCAAWPQVDVRCADLFSEMPHGSFDLIIFSEIGYYFSDSQLSEITVRLWDRLRPEGELIAAHWLGHSEDHALHGDVVHNVLRDHIPVTTALNQRREGFRLDAWIKA